MTTAWQPYKQLRLRKRIVTETRTVEVEVRREELVVETVDLPAGGETTTAVPATPTFEFILSEERVELTRTVVPLERVTVSVAPLDEVVDVSVPVAHEDIKVEYSD